MPLPYEDSREVQWGAPAGSIPTTRAGVMAAKRRKMEQEAGRAPPLTPMAQEEMADLDLAQQVPRESMDRQYNRMLRGADAGPLSQGSRAAKNAEYQQGAELRNAANRATIMRNRAGRDVTSRDMQWQAAQQEQQFARDRDAREFGMREKEFEYRKTQDQRAAEQADKASRANIFLRMAQSEDPYVRAQGEEGLRQLEGGGSAAPSAPATFAQQAQSELVGPQAGPMGPSTATPQSPYQARVQSIREKEAQDKADRETERQMKLREQEIKLKGLETGLARGEEDRARAVTNEERQRRLAGAKVMMEQALESGDEGLYAESLRIISEESGVGQGADFGNAAAAATRGARMKSAGGRRKEASDFVRTDPTYQNELIGLQEVIGETGDIPWWQDLGDIGKMGMGDPYVDQTKVDAVAEQIKAAAERVAQSTGVTPQEVLQQMRGDLSQAIGGAAAGPKKALNAVMRKLLGEGASTGSETIGPFPRMAANREPGGGPAF